MSAGFAVALSGVAAAGSLAGSLAAGSFLFGGSSSRVLRASFLLRTVAAVCCAAAIPANPFAPAFLLVGAVLFNGAGNAGPLATNERLFRLAPPQARVHCQSRFVGSTAAAAGTGAVICAVALTLRHRSPGPRTRPCTPGRRLLERSRRFGPRSQLRGVARPPLPPDAPTPGEDAG